MSDTSQIIEKLNRLTPLGMRFWDGVRGELVGEGLQVSTYPKGLPTRRVAGFVNRSGVYSFQDLPGLRELEFGAGDNDFWKALKPRTFVVEVEDKLRRFQPFRFEAQLPFRGLFELPCLGAASPPQPNEQPEASLPLFSAAGRAVPGDMAVLRAELYDPVADKPAAWALLEVRSGGKLLGRGLADAKGRVCVIFAYPEPLDFPEINDSPVGPALVEPAKALTDQEWTLQLRAAYRPQAPPPALPDLCTVLSQPGANLWADEGRTRKLSEAKLAYGQPLVVRSDPIASPPGISPQVWITPAP